MRVYSFTLMCDSCCICVSFCAWARTQTCTFAWSWRPSVETCCVLCYCVCVCVCACVCSNILSVLWLTGCRCCSVVSMLSSCCLSVVVLCCVVLCCHWPCFAIQSQWYLNWSALSLPPSPPTHPAALKKPPKTNENKSSQVSIRLGLLRSD